MIQHGLQLNLSSRTNNGRLELIYWTFYQFVELTFASTLINPHRSLLSKRARRMLNRETQSAINSCEGRGAPHDRKLVVFVFATICINYDRDVALEKSLRREEEKNLSPTQSRKFRHREFWMRRQRDDCVTIWIHKIKSKQWDIKVSSATSIKSH